MAVSLFTSEILSGLFGDDQMAGLLDDAADIAAMIAFERALAEAQGDLGIIPQAAADQISDILATATVASDALRLGTAASGVPTIALIAELRRGLPKDARQWLHWGATSQDVVDTGRVLQIREALALLGGRLGTVIDSLEARSRHYGDQPLAGRTRSQIATPITLGYRIAQWAHPLIDAENALPALRKSVLRVQMGGAVGANTVLCPDGITVIDRLAQRLGLEASPSWHGNRFGMLDLSNWLVQITAGLSKMAGDLVLLGRSEIAEVHAGASGGSSTMPQKANPVQAETIQALASIAAACQAGMAAAASPAEERDGARWPLEWAFLPQMLLATAAALRHAQQIADSLQASEKAIAATFVANPTIMAEAASFALSRHMPRTEAQAIVKAAAASDLPFADALKAATSADIDWDTVLDPASAVPAGKAMAERIFARRLGAA